MKRVTIQLVGLFSFVALSLSGCGSSSRNQPPTAAAGRPNSSAAALVTTVSITNKEFDPPLITVPAGTTVTWKNNDHAEHTVSSDPYPIDTDLSGFNSVQTISPGKTFSFTFTKVGDWSYHDQLRPVSYTGKVVVTGQK